MEKPVTAAIERVDQWGITRCRTYSPFNHGCNLIILDYARSAWPSLAKATAQVYLTAISYNLKRSLSIASAAG